MARARTWLGLFGCKSFPEPSFMKFGIFSLINNHYYFFLYKDGLFSANAMKINTRFEIHWLFSRISRVDLFNISRPIHMSSKITNYFLQLSQFSDSPMGSTFPKLCEWGKWQLMSRRMSCLFDRWWFTTLASQQVTLGGISVFLIWIRLKSDKNQFLFGCHGVTVTLQSNTVLSKTLQFLSPDFSEVWPGS